MVATPTNNIRHELDILAIEQAAIESCPRYNEARLKQIVQGINPIDVEPGIWGSSSGAGGAETKQ